MSRPPMTSVWVAIALQLLAAGYLQVVEWVPLFPWNDLARGNAQERTDVALAVVQLLIVAGYVAMRLTFMALGLGFYAVWLALQLASWWPAYLLGGRTVGPRWYFARTYKFLPAIDARPTPDANHVVLQLLLLATIVACVVALRDIANVRRTAV